MVALETLDRMALVYAIQISVGNTIKFANAK